jgi:hypothetical protein
MTDTPAWLAPGNEAPAPSPAADSGTSTTTSPPMGSMGVETNNTTTGTDTDDKDLPSVILMMRLLNMGVAGAIIAVSVRSHVYASEQMLSCCLKLM